MSDVVGSRLRQHMKERPGGGWTAKRPYATPAAAWDRALAEPDELGAVAYVCGVCELWHVGHLTKEAARPLRLAELGARRRAVARVVSTATRTRFEAAARERHAAAARAAAVELAVRWPGTALARSVAPPKAKGPAQTPPRDGREPKRQRQAFWREVQARWLDDGGPVYPVHDGHWH